MAWDWQFLLFFVHDSHYDADYFDTIAYNCIHTFILKVGDKQISA